jgi:antitoxin (DNA-binding transcriptional repressor) of toxin-antitoxin stability system
MTWDKVPTRGVELAALLSFIKAMPEGQIWRHNVAGDISGEGEAVDAVELGQIVAANRGRKGFTYTHKKSETAIKWARHATEWGFTINLSADDAGEADTLAAHGLPVVCIVPIDTPKHTTTPEGRAVLVCPAQTVDYMTCALCGLCQRADRKQIIGFRAHGTKARETDRKARRVIPIAVA